MLHEVAARRLQQLFRKFADRRRLIQRFDIRRAHLALEARSRAELASAILTVVSLRNLIQEFSSHQDLKTMSDTVMPAVVVMRTPTAAAARGVSTEDLSLSAGALFVEGSDIHETELGGQLARAVLQQQKAEQQAATNVQRTARGVSTEDLSLSAGALYVEGSDIHETGLGGQLARAVLQQQKAEQQAAINVQRTDRGVSTEDLSLSAGALYIEGSDVHETELGGHLARAVLQHEKAEQQAAINVQRTDRGVSTEDLSLSAGALYVEGSDIHETGLGGQLARAVQQQKAEQQAAINVQRTDREVSTEDLSLSAGTLFVEGSNIHETELGGQLARAVLQQQKAGQQAASNVQRTARGVSTEDLSLSAGALYVEGSDIHETELGGQLARAVLQHEKAEQHAAINVQRTDRGVSTEDLSLSAGALYVEGSDIHETELGGQLARAVLQEQKAEHQVAVNVQRTDRGVSTEDLSFSAGALYVEGSNIDETELGGQLARAVLQQQKAGHQAAIIVQRTDRGVSTDDPFLSAGALYVESSDIHETELGGQLARAVLQQQKAGHQAAINVQRTDRGVSTEDLPLSAGALYVEGSDILETERSRHLARAVLQQQKAEQQAAINVQRTDRGVSTEDLSLSAGAFYVEGSDIHGTELGGQLARAVLQQQKAEQQAAIDVQRTDRGVSTEDLSLSAGALYVGGSDIHETELGGQLARAVLQHEKAEHQAAINFQRTDRGVSTEDLSLSAGALYVEGSDIHETGLGGHLARAVLQHEKAEHQAAINVQRKWRKRKAQVHPEKRFAYRNVDLVNEKRERGAMAFQRAWVSAQFRKVVAAMVEKTAIRITIERDAAGKKLQRYARRRRDARELAARFAVRKIILEQVGFRTLLLFSIRVLYDVVRHRNARAHETGRTSLCLELRLVKLFATWRRFGWDKKEKETETETSIVLQFFVSLRR